MTQERIKAIELSADLFDADVAAAGEFVRLRRLRATRRRVCAAVEASRAARLASRFLVGDDRLSLAASSVYSLRMAECEIATDLALFGCSEAIGLVMRAKDEKLARRLRALDFPTPEALRTALAARISSKRAYDLGLLQ